MSPTTKPGRVGYLVRELEAFAAELPMLVPGLRPGLGDEQTEAGMPTAGR